MHGPHRMCPDNVDDPVTLPVAPSSGPYVYQNNNVIYSASLCSNRGGTLSILDTSQNLPNIQQTREGTEK